MPNQQLPTAVQRAARIAAERGLERTMVYPRTSDVIRREWWRVPPKELVVYPRSQTFYETAALNVAVKLVRMAFSNYASGGVTKAHRPIPPLEYIGGVDTEEFVLMVTRYVGMLIKADNLVKITCHEGRIYLLVHTHEPAIAKEYPSGVICVEL